MSFDLYPLETIESRKHYYSRAIPECWLTMFTHDPEIPWAYVRRDERGRIVALKPHFKSLQPQRAQSSLRKP
jgi:hypothetical protein